ncbi:MAG: hypothetical protein M1827_006045 [Pycnora praestabilis]|nr:MAG: hypothetical protein M1827_006045 [Pycnora praestabilis]
MRRFLNIRMLLDHFVLLCLFLVLLTSASAVEKQLATRMLAGTQEVAIYCSNGYFGQPQRSYCYAAFDKLNLDFSRYVLERSSFTGGGSHLGLQRNIQNQHKRLIHPYLRYNSQTIEFLERDATPSWPHFNNIRLPQEWASDNRRCVIYLATMSSLKTPRAPQVRQDLTNFNEILAAVVRISLSCVQHQHSGGMQIVGQLGELTVFMYGPGGRIDRARKKGLPLDPLEGQDPNRYDLLHKVESTTSEIPGDPEHVQINVDVVYEGPASRRSCGSTYCEVGDDCCFGYECGWSAVNVLSEGILMGTQKGFKEGMVGSCSLSKDL